MQRARILAAVFLCLVAGFGVYGIAFYARLPGRLPVQDDWKAAATVLGRDTRTGDAVALAPMWAERARLFLPPGLPVMSFPSYLDEDLVNVRRVWLLALPAAPGTTAKKLAAELAAKASAVDGPQRLGNLELTRYDLKSPTLPLAYLPDRLEGAKVTVGSADCPREGGTFRCPAPPWVKVERVVREVNYLPRVCLYAHPNPDPAAPLTIEFPAVPLGKTLRGHTGILGEQMLDGNAPVTLAVSVDGAPIGQAEEPPRTPGWHLFQLDTAKWAGQPHALSFRITAPDVWQRIFCFEAMTLP